MKANGPLDPMTALKAHIAKFPSQAKAAESIGMSQQLLSQVIRGKIGFSDTLLDKLGLRRVVVSK